MNFLQFGCFILFVFAVLTNGTFIYNFVNPKGESFLNISVYLGEVLLLGSIFIVAELFALSIVGLYRAPFLWAVVILNMLLIMQKSVRKQLQTSTEALHERAKKSLKREREWAPNEFKKDPS